MPSRGLHGAMHVQISSSDAKNGVSAAQASAPLFIQMHILSGAIRDAGDITVNKESNSFLSGVCICVCVCTHVGTGSFKFESFGTVQKDPCQTGPKEGTGPGWTEAEGRL